MNQYQFRGRMKVAPQTRIASDSDSPGWLSLDELKAWCSQHLFNYQILLNGQVIFEQD